MKASHRATVVAVLLLLGVAVVPSAGASPPSLANPPHVAASDSIYVAATGDYGYTPDTFEDLPTNTNITVTFVDNSTMTDGHTFTILGEEGVQLPTDTSQAEINRLAFGNSPPRLFNANVSAYGDRNVSILHSPGPGWYEFVCTVSSHFQNGMYGFIAFGMDLPTNLTLPNRTNVGGNLSFNATDAAVIGAIVAVLVLGFVVLRRRRGAQRMPPEPVGRSRTASSGAPPPEPSRKEGGR
jgi:uncharacterized cupredoxin-like copper-binding protein